MVACAWSPMSWCWPMAARLNIHDITKSIALLHNTWNYSVGLSSLPLSSTRRVNHQLLTVIGRAAQEWAIIWKSTGWCTTAGTCRMSRPLPVPKWITSIRTGPEQTTGGRELLYGHVSLNEPNYSPCAGRGSQIMVVAGDKRPGPHPMGNSRWPLCYYMKGR